MSIPHFSSSFLRIHSATSSSLLYRLGKFQPSTAIHRQPQCIAHTSILSQVRYYSAKRSAKAAKALKASRPLPTTKPKTPTTIAKPSPLGSLFSPWPTATITPRATSKPAPSKPVSKPISKPVSKITPTAPSTTLPTKPLPKPPTSLRTPHFPLSPQSLLETLSSHPHSTPLYNAYTTRLSVGSYTLVLLCTTWCIYTYFTNIHSPVDLNSPIVTYATYTGISLISILILLAAYYPTRWIRAIHAIPVPGAQGTPPTIKIQITQAPLLPLLPPRMFVLPVEDLYLSGPLELEEAAVGVEEAKKGVSWVRRVVDFVSWLPWRVFSGAKDLFTTAHFVSVFIKGRQFPLVVSKKGWEWEKRGLEKLIGQRKPWV